MAFIGTPLDTRNTFQSLAGKRFNGDGSTTAFTLDVAPSSTLDIEVFVGNVRQDPNSAYTLSGTTLTFTGAPPSGTNNIYVVHQAKSVGTIDVPSAGVQSGSLASTFLTGQTDIGAAIADADLFLVDDGAGGTLRKTAASRLKTYTESGKILQVVSGVASAGATSTSSTFAQKSTPTVSITPSSSSSKVFVTGHIYGDPNTDYLMVTFGRVISGGATTTNISGETYGLGMFNVNREDNMSIHFLDSPSTTSAVSYYFYFKNDNNSTSVGLGHNSVGASITAMEVQA